MNLEYRKAINQEMAMFEAFHAERASEWAIVLSHKETDNSKQFKTRVSNFNQQFRGRVPELKQDITSLQVGCIERQHDVLVEISFKNLKSLTQRLAIRVGEDKAHKLIDPKTHKEIGGVATYFNNEQQSFILEDKGLPTRLYHVYRLFIDRAKYGGFIPFTEGNGKILGNILCLSLESATYCSSKKLGHCGLCEECYAFAYERQYDTALIRNEINRFYFGLSSAEEIAGDLITKQVIRSRKSNHKNWIKGVRLSCEGDLTNQVNLDKANKIADILGCFGILVYGYTHNKDLDFKGLVENININGSTTAVETDNHYLAIPKDKIPLEAKHVCPCSSADNTAVCGVDCDFCYHKDGRTIYEELR